MTEITVTRQQYPDSITIGRVSKGGEIKVYFDADDLTGAQRRVDVAVQIRTHLIERLGSAL
jgi:YbbR domain-containing protein